MISSEWLDRPCAHFGICPHGFIRNTPAGTVVAAFHFTIAILPGGPWLITQPPVWYKPEKLKTSKELEDADLKGLVVRPLREKKPKKKKAATAEDEVED